MGLAILLLGGVLLIALAAGSAGATEAQPKPPPPPQPPPQPPKSPLEPSPIPTPPGLPPGGEALFDVAPDGSRVFKPPVAAAVVGSLDSFIPVPVGGDATTIKLVPRPPGTDPTTATAKHWAVTLNTTGGRTILASTWVTVPRADLDRFLRAVTPGTEAQLAGQGGQYAVLAFPNTLGAVAPSLPSVPTTPAPPVLPGPIPGLPSIPGITPPPAPGPSVPPPSAADPYSELPPALQAMARELDAHGDPDAMLLAANELEKAGFKASAARLRKRAAERRNEIKAEQVLTGKTYVIRSGDYPSFLAKHYTGDGMRWKELLSVNPEMSTYTDAKGQTQIKPWKVGQTIILPGSWDTAKGPPPQLGMPQAMKSQPGSAPVTKERTIYWNYNIQKWVDDQGNPLAQQPPPPGPGGPITKKQVAISGGRVA